MLKKSHLLIAALLLFQSAMGQFSRNQNNSLITQRSNQQRFAAGSYFTLEIRNGVMWGWGYNTYGELGNGTQTFTPLPAQMNTDNDWVSVAAGFYHAAAIKANGTLWAWGMGVYGQLGDGTSYDHFVPKQVGKDSQWVAVACGTYHTLALKADGSLWAFGYDYYGQIGDTANANVYKPHRVGNANNWIAIACGAHHSLALKADGTIWGWGRNGSGELGDGSNSNRNVPVQIGIDNNWVSISGGTYHSMARKADGTLWTWGSNGNGQLGDGTNIDHLSPVKVNNDNNWVFAVCGNEHSLAIKSDGTLWGWGLNAHGQIGNSTVVDANKPVKASSKTDYIAAAGGYYHTVVSRANGSVYTFGRNNHGQLGANISNLSLAPVFIHKAINWVTVHSADHTTALKSDGTLWGWGRNDQSQIGDGSTATRLDPVAVGTDTNWIGITGSNTNGFGIRTNGTLWAWGGNTYGNLGDSSTTNRKNPVQIGKSNQWISISASETHTLGLKCDGTMWAWGRNNTGQLGDNSTTDRIVPIQIGVGTRWKQIAAGQGHSMAIAANGEVYTWGNNNQGQLGYTSSGSYTQLPQKVSGFSDCIGLAAGEQYSLVLDARGKAWAFGNNNFGQLGDSTVQARLSAVLVKLNTTVIQIQAGYKQAAALGANGNCYFWGSNLKGQSGLGAMNQALIPTLIANQFNTVNISAGEKNAAKISCERQQICITGDNSNGQLGLGNTNNSNQFICQNNAYRSMDIDSVSRLHLCAGDSFSVYFKAIGRFTSGNLFNLELSDSAGNFSKSKIIGSTHKDGRVKGFVPYKSGLGNAYRVRIKSTEPLAEGNNCGQNMAISKPNSQIISMPKLAYCKPSVYQVHAKYTAGNIYQWMRNQVAIPGFDTTHSDSVSANYNLISTDAFGCKDTSQSLTIEMLDKPVILTQPKHNITMLGKDGFFFVKSNLLSDSFQWQRDTGNGFNDLPDAGIFYGVHNDSLYINPVNEGMKNHIFRCRVFNRAQCEVWSDTAHLEIFYENIIGIEEAENFIFPNPANTELYINLTHPGVLNIYNSAGICIYSNQIIGLAKINTQQYIPGLYFIQCADLKNRQSHFIKLQITH